VILTRRLYLQTRLRKSGTISLLPTYTSVVWTGINVVAVVAVVVVYVPQLHRVRYNRTATVSCTNYRQVSFYTISFCAILL